MTVTFHRLPPSEKEADAGNADLRRVRGSENGIQKITGLIIAFLCFTAHKIVPVLFNY